MGLGGGYSFDFTPKYVIVDNGKAAGSESHSENWIYNISYASIRDTTGVHLTWLSDGISWYSERNEYYQFNGNGSKYFWLAIG